MTVSCQIASNAPLLVHVKIVVGHIWPMGQAVYFLVLMEPSALESFAKVMINKGKVLNLIYFSVFNTA